MNAIRHFLLALQFFTRIPVTGRLAGWVGYSPAMLRASAAHFPGVGWIVALLACSVFGAFMSLLPASSFTPLAAAVFSTIATVLLTGGFHEDGLADVADGLGGSLDRQRALDIMKDSRIGAFGALALVLGLLAKVSMLAVLGSQSTTLAVAALAGAHVLSRFAPLLLVRALPHVGDDASSKSKPLADRISGPALLVAALWCLPALALAAWMTDPRVMLAAAGACGLALLWMWRMFSRRLQGFTGDCLGATQQVCEIAFYLGVALAW
ncbi:MAG: adenosylcobinamide-GDP ribazoletransferase [Pseudomonadota bacterium]